MATAMVMTMVMAIMALPIATATSTMVMDIPIDILTVVAGVANVIGDETTGWGGRGQPESH
jgi:hypothetical protein